MTTPEEELLRDISTSPAERPSLGGLVEALAVATREGDRLGTSWLQQLREAVGGGTSKNAAGAAEQWRIPLNAAASDLWTRLVDDIASLLEGASGMKPSVVPQVNLLAWWAAFAAAHDRGEFVDSSGVDAAEQMLDVAAAKLQSWTASIRGLLDPPRTKHIILPCPLCGAQRIVIGEGDAAVVTDALVIEFRAGVDAIGYCRNPGCGGLWVGERALVDLGRAAGAAIRFDEVLRSSIEIPRVVVPDTHREDFDPKNPEHVALWHERAQRSAINPEGAR